MNPADSAYPHQVLQHLPQIQLAPKTTLLHQGDTATNLYFVRQGCLRACFNKNGQIVTAQFFLEGQTATAFESFMTQQPSQLSLECIEPCQLNLLTKAAFDRLRQNDPLFQDWFYQTAIQKLIQHTHRLLSFIKDTPQQRYAHLLDQQPELLERIPQHYIASYLGITSVSLSRIKNRKVGGS